MTRYFFEEFHPKRKGQFYGVYVRRDGINFTPGFWGQWCKELDKVKIFIDKGRKAFKLTLDPDGYTVLSRGATGGVNIKGIELGRYDCVSEENGSFIFKKQ